MFGRIQKHWDNRVLITYPEFISRTKQNNDYCISCRQCRYCMVGSLPAVSYKPNWGQQVQTCVRTCVAHLYGRDYYQDIVKRVRPCYTLDDDEQPLTDRDSTCFRQVTTASFAMVGVAPCVAKVITFMPILMLCNGLRFQEFICVFTTLRMLSPVWF